VHEARDPHADSIGHVARVEGLGVRGDEELERAIGAFRSAVATAARRRDEEEGENGPPSEAGLFTRGRSS
jgi:hypothetical protein